MSHTAPLMENSLRKWRARAKDDFRNGNEMECYEIIKLCLVSIANTGFLPQDAESNAESLFFDDINNLYIPNTLLIEPEENRFDRTRVFFDLCCRFDLSFADAFLNRLRQAGWALAEYQADGQEDLLQAPTIQRLSVQPRNT